MDNLEEKVCLFMDIEECLDESQSNGSSENSSDSHDPEDRSMYWESQEALLQEILERYNLSGSTLREEISQIIQKVKAMDFCHCLEQNSSGCPSCLRAGVVAMLCEKGFNATLCISKWGHTKKIPGGSHNYIEVIVSTSTRKKEMRYLIELELRDQFKIAKASEEYQKLMSWLPEYYIGKPEYLTGIVGVMCDAAKRSMKEKKIHMGPWRKSSFMQMKWSSGLNQRCTHLDESLSRVTSFSLGQRSTSCDLRVSGAPAMVVTSTAA